MDNNEILAKLKRILTEQLSVTVELNEKTALLGDKILDSMDFINYVTCIEEEFNTKISDDDISNLKLGIIENMIKYLKK